MPLYMSTFEYKPEVSAELVHSPENRTETVTRILDDAGCKLKGSGMPSAAATASP